MAINPPEGSGLLNHTVTRLTVIADEVMGQECNSFPLRGRNRKSGTSQAVDTPATMIGSAVSLNNVRIVGNVSFCKHTKRSVST